MKSYTAGGTIRVSRFVNLSTTETNTVLEADANEKVTGITQAGGRTAPTPDVTTDPVEAAQDGETLGVHVAGELDSQTVLLELGTGGATAGDYLESDADGKGVTAATTAETIRYIGAEAQESGSAGEKIRVIPRSFTLTNPA